MRIFIVADIEGAVGIYRRSQCYFLKPDFQYGKSCLTKDVNAVVAGALEGGADVIVLPYPGQDSLKTISQFSSVPWLVKPPKIDDARSVLSETLALGGSGLWLDQTVFTQSDPAGFLEGLLGAIHPPSFTPQPVSAAQ